MPLTQTLAGVLAASTGSTGASSGGGGGSSLVSFLPLLLIVAVGYFLLIRPARTRQRKAAETRSSVQPGSEVITTAGLVATVISVDDDTVTLEVAPGVHSRYLKGAIARVNEPAGASDDIPGDDLIPDSDDRDVAIGTDDVPPAADQPIDLNKTDSAPTQRPADGTEPGSTGL